MFGQDQKVKVDALTTLAAMTFTNSLKLVEQNERHNGERTLVSDVAIGCVYDTGGNNLEGISVTVLAAAVLTCNVEHVVNLTFTFML